jgi:hypothetical protein
MGEPELIGLANSYFIKKVDGIHFKYVGPKGEYQKWYYILHKEHKNKACKEWRLKNLEHDRNRSKIKGLIHSFIDKLNALRKVSGLKEPMCSKCGVKDIRILTINHLNGDGAKERVNRVCRTYRQIRLGRKIDDLEVRCYNCNILYEYEQGRRNLPLNWKELYGA